MARIDLVDPASATGDTLAMLTDVKRTIGHVPDLMRALALSPASLKGFLAMRSALSGMHMPLILRERIAIAVAQANACEACLEAHSAYARKNGLSESEIDCARRFESCEPQAQAVLALARSILNSHGLSTAPALADARRSGINDVWAIEVATLVGLNVLTNIVNNLAG